MSSNEISASYLSLSSERCNFKDISGVKNLTTATGVNLVNIAEGLHESLSKFQQLLNEALDRIKVLESGGSLGHGSGEVGPMGPQGPAGPAGKGVNKLEDIKNVKIPSGSLKDGLVLSYSVKDSAWIGVQIAGDDE